MRSVCFKCTIFKTFYSKHEEEFTHTVVFFTLFSILLCFAGIRGTVYRPILFCRYPWHASCVVKWQISDSCQNIQSRLVNQFNAWQVYGKKSGDTVPLNIYSLDVLHILCFLFLLIEALIERVCITGFVAP